MRFIERLQEWLEYRRDRRRTRRELRDMRQANIAHAQTPHRLSQLALSDSDDVGSTAIASRRKGAAAGRTGSSQLVRPRGLRQDAALRAWIETDERRSLAREWLASPKSNIVCSAVVTPPRMTTIRKSSTVYD
jgi:hypothetical protein